MDWDEARPKPLRDLAIGESLEALSIAELEARLQALEGEAARTRAEIQRKTAHADAARSIFKS